MECLVDNVLVSKQNIGVRGMNFGQKVHDREVLEYKITLDIQEFRSIIQKTYDNFVDEMKIDDAIDNDYYSIELFEQGYPLFDDAIINNTKLLEQMIKEVCCSELLHGCFPAKKDRYTYLVNTINNLIILNDKVSIIGDIYKV